MKPKRSTSKRARTRAAGGKPTDRGSAARKKDDRQRKPARTQARQARNPDNRTDTMRAPELANDLLIWIDLETTGLSPSVDAILEVATIVTDGDLNPLDQLQMVIHRSDEVLEGMNDWCKRQHNLKTEDGLSLVDSVRASAHTDDRVEKAFCDLLDRYKGTGPMVVAGSSVHFDLQFLHARMPALASRLHYRIVDVSTVFELCKRWAPSLLASLPPGPTRHRAMDDIRRSLEFMRFYRANFFRTDASSDPLAFSPGDRTGSAVARWGSPTGVDRAGFPAPSPPIPIGNPRRASSQRLEESPPISFFSRALSPLLFSEMHDRERKGCPRADDVRSRPASNGDRVVG